MVDAGELGGLGGCLIRSVSKQSTSLNSVTGEMGAIRDLSTCSVAQHVTSRIRSRTTSHTQSQVCQSTQGYSSRGARMALKDPFRG